MWSRARPEHWQLISFTADGTGARSRTARTANGLATAAMPLRAGRRDSQSSTGGPSTASGWWTTPMHSVTTADSQVRPASACCTLTPRPGSHTTLGGSLFHKFPSFSFFLRTPSEFFLVRCRDGAVCRDGGRWPWGSVWADWVADFPTHLHALDGAPSISPNLIFFPKHPRRISPLFLSFWAYRRTLLPSLVPLWLCCFSLVSLSVGVLDCLLWSALLSLAVFFFDLYDLGDLSFCRSCCQITSTSTTER